MSDKKKIEELEKRISELESRPQFVILPQIVYAPPPNYYPFPGSIPGHPYLTDPYRYTWTCQGVTTNG